MCVWFFFVEDAHWVFSHHLKLALVIVNHKHSGKYFPSRWSGNSPCSACCVSYTEQQLHRLYHYTHQVSHYRSISMHSSCLKLGFSTGYIPVEILFLLSSNFGTLLLFQDSNLNLFSIPFYSSLFCFFLLSSLLFPLKEEEIVWQRRKV